MVEISSKAIEILRQADALKGTVVKREDLLTCSKSWSNQQRLQSIYQQALLLDLEYSLDNKVDQDLWNIGFKKYIVMLQDLARDKKLPDDQRNDCQTLLTWCLEAASGFYLNLLHELCGAFDVFLPFRRVDNVFGQIAGSVEVNNVPRKASCLYICHYSLVHLGDIARYRNEKRQAESFYKQAIMVSPNSGHPYNQLALLEASQNNHLSTVYYYIRAIAVKNPFPASTTNLLNIFTSIIDKDCGNLGETSKLSPNEFVQQFLCVHACMHTSTRLKQASVAVKTLNSTMTALVATESFSKDTLIQMAAINLYTWQYLTRRGDQNRIDMLQELIAGSLSAFLVPVYTLKVNESLLDYNALPAISLIMYFIRENSTILTEAVFTSRLQIWPSLCKLINHLSGCYKKMTYEEKYNKMPIYEDHLLQGFWVFEKPFNAIDFQVIQDDLKVEKLIRVRRITDFCLWLSEVDVNGSTLIVKNTANADVHFEPGSIQPDPTSELLEEMRSLDVESKLEKKGGILKPQGSLEKAREERDSSTIRTDQTKKRAKQNVALQSIIKKMELESNKQVKFNVMNDTKVEEDATRRVPSPSTDYLRSLRGVDQNFDQPYGMFKNSVPFYPQLAPFTPFQRAANKVVWPQPRPEEAGLPSLPTWWSAPPPSNYPQKYSSWMPPDTFSTSSYDELTTARNGPMSMRQAMLKEANVPLPLHQVHQQNQGYSLFSTPNWTPARGGQQETTQQHAFPAQSLVELLEHQNQVDPKT